MLKSKRLLVALMALSLAGLAIAHHDSEPETGPAAMLQHTDTGERLIMELVMPHRYAESNQLLINFFDAEGGGSTQPDTVTVQFAGPNSDERGDPITLDSNGPVYSAPAAGITGPGIWTVHVDVTIDEQTDTEFEVSVEFF